MLEQHAQCGAHRVGIEFADAQAHERARPVQSLRNRRRLAQSELANRTDKSRRLGRQLRVEVRHLELDNFSLLLSAGKVDEQMATGAPQRLEQLTPAI